MFTFVRVAALTIAGFMLLGAFAVAAAPDGGVGAAIVPALIGGGIVVAVLLERTRYRSQAAERGGLDPGPGGGESAPLDWRFRPTGEVFVDPPSGRLMRVYVDERSGERRYVAER